MQPNITENNGVELKRFEVDARLERAKGAAHFGAILLAGWLVAAILRSAYPGGGISHAPSLGGPTFGLWLCGMWATVTVYWLLDAGKTQRGFRDWFRILAMVAGSALIWAIVYSGQTG